MVMVTAVMHVIPNSGYKRYIRFFTGLVLVVMLSDPFLKLLGTGDLWQNLYDSPVYREQVEKMEQAAKYLDKMPEDFEDRINYSQDIEASLKQDEEEGTSIEVEEIQIGR